MLIVLTGLYPVGIVTPASSSFLTHDGALNIAIFPIRYITTFLYNVWVCKAKSPNNILYKQFHYGDMSKFDIYHRDIAGNLNEDETIKNALEDFKNAVVTNKPILVEIQNHLGGRALAVGIQSGSDYNSFLVITYYDRPKEFVYAYNHWEVYRLVTSLGMEYGTTDMNRTPGQVTTKHITFQNRLSAFPKVFVCPHTKSPDGTTVSASEATYDGFDIYCYSKAAKEPLAISWMAWY